MKEMLESFQWAWKYDRKEFVTGILFVIGWLAMVWFMFCFFIPTFAYDM